MKIMKTFLYFSASFAGWCNCYCCFLGAFSKVWEGKFPKFPKLNPAGDDLPVWPEIQGKHVISWTKMWKTDETCQAECCQFSIFWTRLPDFLVIKGTMFNKSAQGRQRVNEHHPRVNMGRVQYLLKRQDRLGSDFDEFLAECMSGETGPYWL